MPRRANTQTQQEAVQENAAVQANTGADMQMEAAITKTQPEKGVLALADVKIGDFMTIRNVRIKEDDYGLTVAMPKTKAGANEQYKDTVFFADRGIKERFDQTVQKAYETFMHQQTDLDEKTTQLSEQQTKIDNIIGVKAEVVEALQKEFQKNNINVNLDSQTGALTLDASVLFDVDESELTDAGKEALRNVLPIYCKVLMEDTYKNYLAEIIIDGYTDTDGDYAYNLELSQQRSLAVAQYLLDIQGEFLTEDQSLNLQDYLTVNGHSMANPILDADGNVDKEASRRVEVKFRLKDDEMIEELSKIMAGSEESAADTATEAGADAAAN
mgnify:FL=1